MLLDNPMPPGAISDAIRCFQRADRTYREMPPWRRATARAEGLGWLAVIVELVAGILEALAEWFRPEVMA